MVAALANQGYIIADPTYSKVAPPFGVPKITWPSNGVVWQMYQDHPDWFSENSTNQSSEILGSFFMKETISSGYVRLDNKFLHNRLKLTYGIRFERTDDSGQGPISWWRPQR